MEVEVAVGVEVVAPPAAGVAGWLANVICRSKDGVPLPQPWPELPAAAPSGASRATPADSCLVELLSVTLATPSISRRRDISLATSGWLLVQPVRAIEVPVGAPVLVGAAVPALVAADVAAVPVRVASEVFFGNDLRDLGQRRVPVEAAGGQLTDRRDP